MFLSNVFFLLFMHSVVFHRTDQTRLWPTSIETTSQQITIYGVMAYSVADLHIAHLLWGPGAVKILRPCCTNLRVQHDKVPHHSHTEFSQTPNYRLHRSIWHWFVPAIKLAYTAHWHRASPRVPVKTATVFCCFLSFRHLLSKKGKITCWESSGDALSICCSSVT